MTFPKIIFLLAAFAFSEASQAQGQAYNASNDVSIKITGNTRDYVFGSRDFAGRYNKNDKRFEFYLPVPSVYATSDTSDLYLFRDIFAGYENAQDFFITATFADELTSLAEFKTPTDMVLDGLLTLPNYSLSLPVYMKVFYNNNILFYSMRMELDLDLIAANIPPHYLPLLSGEMQLLVSEGRWNNGTDLR